jgi:DNA-binding HxlR family transcriptional regulator
MEKIFVKFSDPEKCPVRNVLDRLGDKWSVLIILILGEAESLRFKLLQKAIGNVSQKMLSITLKTLEADGIVSRHVFAEVPLRVEYRLTERGESLLPLIKQLSDWATKNMKQIVKDRKSYVTE